MRLLGILEFERLEFEHGCYDFLTLSTLVEPLKHAELPFVHLENGDKSDRLRKLQGKLNKILHTKLLLAPSKQQITNWIGEPIQTDFQFHPSAPLHIHEGTDYTVAECMVLPGARQPRPFPNLWRCLWDAGRERTDPNPDGLTSFPTRCWYLAETCLGQMKQ